jgi:hypothetical protein
MAAQFTNFLFVGSSCSPSPPIITPIINPHAHDTLPSCESEPPRVDSEPLSHRSSCWRVPSPSGQEHFVEVTNSCGVTNLGAVHCWTDRLKEVPDGRFVAVESSGFDACGLLSSGKVLCWGDSIWDVPDDKVASVSLALGKAAHGSDACGILSDQTGIICWTGTSVVPDSGSRKERYANSGFIDVGVEKGDACAVVEDGSVECWSRLDGGRRRLLGTFVQVSVGAGFSCARSSGGTVHCWGRDFLAPRDGLVPPDGLDGVILVRAGMNHACALKASGEVVCWGHARPPPGIGFRSISRPDYRNNYCGVSLDEHVYCWGQPPEPMGTGSRP